MNALPFLSFQLSEKWERINLYGCEEVTEDSDFKMCV